MSLPEEITLFNVVMNENSVALLFRLFALHTGDV